MAWLRNLFSWGLCHVISQSNIFLKFKKPLRSECRMNHSIKIDNSSLEMVEEFKYLGATLRDQNYIQEEIKRRLLSGNAYYHLVQNILSSSLLSENLKIKIYRTIILHVVLYGCETWSLPWREERRLRVFENRVLRRIFGRKWDEVRGEGRKLNNEELLNP